MNAASTAAGLIGTGIKVVKFIKNAVEEIRDTPAVLQALQQRATTAEMLMEEVQSSQLELLFRSTRDLSVLEDLAIQAKRRIDEIEVFVEKMQRKGKDGEMKVAKVKWLFKRKDVQTLSAKLDQLQNVLVAIINVANS